MKKFLMRVTVHLPDEVAKIAEAVAQKQGMSVSAFYAEAVEAHVKLLKRQQAIKKH